MSYIFSRNVFAYPMLSVLCLVLDFFDASKYLIFNFSCSNTFVSSSVNWNKQGMSRFSKILSFSGIPVSSPIRKVNICLLEIRIYHSDSTVFTTKRSDTYWYTMKHAAFNVNISCSNIFTSSRRNDDSVWNCTCVWNTWQLF